MTRYGLVGFLRLVLLNLSFKDCMIVLCCTTCTSICAETCICVLHCEPVFVLLCRLLSPVDLGPPQSQLRSELSDANWLRPLWRCSAFSDCVSNYIACFSRRTPPAACRLLTPAVRSRLRSIQLSRPRLAERRAGICAANIGLKIYRFNIVINAAIAPLFVALLVCLLLVRAIQRHLDFVIFVLETLTSI